MTNWSENYLPQLHSYLLKQAYGPFYFSEYGAHPEIMRPDSDKIHVTAKSIDGSRQHLPARFAKQ